MIARVVLLNLKVYILFNLAHGIRGEKSKRRIFGLKAPQNSIEKFLDFVLLFFMNFAALSSIQPSVVFPSFGGVLTDLDR